MNFQELLELGAYYLAIESITDDEYETFINILDFDITQASITLFKYLGE